jgi:hypothetical protein
MQLTQNRLIAHDVISLLDRLNMISLLPEICDDALKQTDAYAFVP